MNRHSARTAFVLTSVCLLSAGALQADGVEYERDIKPLLKMRCYACHGALEQEAGLRLDTVASMLRGGDSGPVVVPGAPEDSLLVARVATGDVLDRMPPEFEAEPLTAEEVAVLSEWIAAGAPSPADEQAEADPNKHWAFQPIVRPAVPQVSREAWIKNPIDAFVARQHEALGLLPQGEAPRLVLLRRLSLDLIGLPPTAEEIAEVEKDPASDWYARAVERLLADPRHGERWARHWMDIWRYSDWWGLGDQLRNSQKHIWHWRDWIIESLNEDVPYDEMVRLMLAADELHPNDLDKLRATGYLARNYFLFNRHQWMDETVEHVSKGFLGLTTNCAKCHDHKYDPVSHADYYAMRAFFEPYHVRTDMAPGEADLARDGVPRAFDGLLDQPTYRFIRGEETNPDESEVIAPGVPDVLEFAPLEIEPVELPVEAWQPERRAWVAGAYRESAEEKVAASEAKLAVARDKLAAAERHEADLRAKLNGGTSKPTEEVVDVPEKIAAIVEDFATLDTRRWQLLGGQWAHQPGRLEQKRDGATRAVVQLTEAAPRDFDATARFTILGGSQWRSVGIGFDASQSDPTLAASADDSEQNVYVSAYAAGPKVQASFQRGGNWEYPGAAMIARSIELNREYTLRVRVRDSLVNVSLDGEPVISWRSPLPRRDGRFQLTTFDALVVFHEVSLAPLQDGVVLREPDAGPPDPETPAGAAHAVAEARLELQAAELTLEAARAEVRSVERRAAAMQASWARSDAGDGDGATTLADAERRAALAAARAEREQAAAQARVALVEAELRLHQAAADQRESAAKDMTAAQEALEKAIAQIDEPSDQYTKLSGARWSATRFLNSGADDPAVAFPPTSTGRRSALAAWITDRRNPLTARVAANHIWTRHFGTPLVPSVFDFGRNGAPPTHPQLLDWLAAELIESGWSMKHLHSLIVESATYRLSSSSLGAETSADKDPDNVYYWRRTPTRLESQAVRDTILALTGTLDQSRGGPPVPPTGQLDSRRRSLYFFHSNNERNLFLTMFDEAMVKECYRREQSVVPQQALALTNSRLVLDAAPAIAERLTEELVARGPAGDYDAAFIRLAFAAVLGTEATEAEVAASAAAIDAWKKLSDAPQGDAADGFARANLIWVLLNHNDFVTLR